MRAEANAPIEQVGLSRNNGQCWLPIHIHKYYGWPSPLIGLVLLERGRRRNL